MYQELRLGLKGRFGPPWDLREARPWSRNGLTLPGPLALRQVGLPISGHVQVFGRPGQLALRQVGKLESG